MPRRKVQVAWLWLSALLCALSSPVHAGPVEILNGVSISAADPEHLVVSYAYGQNGLFVSEDGGVTLKWLCAAGAALSASNRNFVVHVGGDGSIYMGLYDGLLRGDKSGCGFQPVPELAMKNVRAMTGDPFVPERTYVVTSNPMADNGIYMKDGSGTFAAFGPRARKFIGTLHVVKNAEARRFYETGISTNAETNVTEYSVRVSDDEAMTWTEEVFDPAPFALAEKEMVDFAIAAVDPTDPARVVGVMRRAGKADTLVFSRQMGRAGSWEKLAEPIETGGVAFDADGALYFGDNYFETKGLYKVDELGAQPKQISDIHRVSCLEYDHARSRLLGCADNYRFGVFDTSSGELTTLLDLRCAEHAVTCPDKPEIQALCQPPAVEFCKVDHWVIAPLCCVYEREDFESFAAAQTMMCVDGRGVPKPEAAGEGGAPVIAPVCPRAAAAAGSSGGAGGGGVAAGADTVSGCGCSSVGGATPGRAAAFGLCLGLLGLALARIEHRRGRRRA